MIEITGACTFFSFASQIEQCVRLIHALITNKYLFDINFIDVAQTSNAAVQVYEIVITEFPSSFARRHRLLSQ
jgi:hypothetical protein